MGGIRSDHIYILVLWIVAYYFNETTRRFILGFSIFIVYWIIYDSMRIIPNYEVSNVHIREPYELEKLLFGININDVILTPNEFFRLHHNTLLDFLSGLFYINWVPIPIAFAFYLYVKNKELFLKFSLVFLLVNIFGFIIYYIYPAAPPWYVDLYGFDLHIGVQGNSAGLERFDQLIGVPVFENIYNKNANVLAAIPSLHSAYPVIVLYFGLLVKMKKINWFFLLFMFGIWFSAVYSSHHYFVDVILGGFLAVITIIGFNYFSGKKSSKKLLKNFITHI